MLGWRACRLGLFFPEIYEMQVRAIVRAAIAVRERGGDAPLVEIMHPLVGFGEELRRLRELTVRVAAEEGELDYLVGTMIELPRACIRADEIAEHADFFSFGTNDLTQTALGISRDDGGRFLAHYLETGVLERDPFETIDQDGVGDLMEIAVERGRRDARRHQARDLRRARRRAEVGRVLPPARARLRQLQPVPRPARPPRRGPGRAGGAGHGRRRDRRLSLGHLEVAALDEHRRRRASTASAAAATTSTPHPARTVLERRRADPPERGEHAEGIEPAGELVQAPDEVAGGGERCRDAERERAARAPRCRRRARASRRGYRALRARRRADDGFPAGEVEPEDGVEQRQRGEDDGAEEDNLDGDRDALREDGAAAARRDTTG